MLEELKEEERKGGNKEKSKERKFQCQSLYTKDSSVEQWGLSTVLTLIKIVNNEKSCCALGSDNVRFKNNYKSFETFYDSYK